MSAVSINAAIIIIELNDTDKAIKVRLALYSPWVTLLLLGNAILSYH